MLNYFLFTSGHICVCIHYIKLNAIRDAFLTEGMPWSVNLMLKFMHRKTRKDVMILGNRSNNQDDKCGDTNAV